MKTGNVHLHYESELTDIEDQGNSVAAIIRNTRAGDTSSFVGSYLVGTDGSKSTARKLAGIQFPGHTWKERLIAMAIIMFYNPCRAHKSNLSYLTK
jgi:2-polyprenyl-6-methoxyphenol hydroxylase-like FAD-dependent oxidoreductase